MDEKYEDSTFLFAEKIEVQIFCVYFVWVWSKFNNRMNLSIPKLVFIKSKPRIVGVRNYFRHKMCLENDESLPRKFMIFFFLFFH